MKNWKVLKTEVEYREALARTIDIFHVEYGTPEFEELELLLVLVKDYENKHIIIPELDPIEVVKLKMEEKGLLSKDLVSWIGSKAYVSALLNRKKPLTLRIAKVLHKKLGIPAAVLLA